MADTSSHDPKLQAFMATLVANLGTSELDCLCPEKTLCPDRTVLQSSGALAQTIVAPHHPVLDRTVLQAKSAADIPTIQHASPGQTPTVLSNTPVPKRSVVGSVPTVRTTHRQESLARWSEFEVHGMVGKGGMGEIYRAGQNALQREVAIKKIIPSHLESDNASQMEQSFISEALVTGYLGHPNIVPVYSLGRDDDGKWFFTMKMVCGIEWRHLLHPEKCKNEEMKKEALKRNLDTDDPVRRAAHLEDNLRILLSICNAVAFAHSKKIIHRDLKPENIMVGAFGEVLVMDWGLAVDVSETPAPIGSPDHRVPARADCGLGGTPSYMAPEQMATDDAGRYLGENLNCWTDVFLLGAMLHEILTGTPPYSGPSMSSVLLKVATCNPPDLPESVPVELAGICRKAMAKNPSERFADADAFQRALTDFMQHRQSALVACKAEHEAHGQDIPSLARAVVLYDQALELWPGNTAAQTAVREARVVLEQKERKARATRHSLVAAVASIIIGLTIGFFWIRSEQSKAMNSMNAEKKAKDAAMISMTEEKKAKEKAVAAVHSQAVSIARGLVAQGDAYIMADRLGQGKARYEQAWDMFNELNEPAERAEWGMWGFHTAAVTPLLTLSQNELTSGTGTAAFSPDGKQALSAGTDDALHLWETSTGIPLATFKGHTKTPCCVAFSADGKYAVSGGLDNTVRLWDIAAAKQIHEFTHSSPLMKWVSFSLDGKHLLSGGSDGTVLTWNVASGANTGTFKREAGSQSIIRESALSVVAESFSPQSCLLISGGNFNAVSVWDAATGKRIHELSRNKDISSFIWGVAFSGDGRLGVSGGRDKFLRCWDIENGTLVREFSGHNSAISAVALSADGSRAVSASWDQTLKLWDLSAGLQSGDLIGHTNKVVGVAMSPDGRNILSRGLDQTLKMWDANARFTPRTFKGHTSGIECIAFSPNGKLAASGGRDSSIRIWDIETGTELRKMRAYARCITFSADGKRVISADNNSTVVQEWSVESGLKTREFIMPFKWATFSPDGKYAFCAGSKLMDFDSTDVKLWDIEKGVEVRNFEGAGNTFYDAAFSIDGGFGATINAEGALKVWALATGKRVCEIKGQFYRAAFSPDGKRFATGNLNGDVQMWDSETGTKVRDFFGHLETVRTLAFSPDGRFIASGSDGKTVKLWDVESGTELREFKAHVSSIGAVTFSPDSRRILSGAEDATLKLWDGSYAARYRDLDAKVADAQKVLAQNSKDAAALNTLGEWFAFRGLNDRAIDVLERARANGATVSGLTLGRAYEALGNLERAAENIDIELTRVRGVLTSLPPKDSNERELREANELQLSISVRVLYSHLSDAPKKAKNHDAYIAAIQKYLSIFEREVKSPDLLADKLNMHAWTVLTNKEPELRDPKFALPLARRAVALTNEKDPSPLDVLALALLRNGFKAEALVAIKKAIAILPPDMTPAARKEYTDLLKEIEEAQ
ncbi:MAG: protein kinase [Planctomycetota bacterium]